MKQFNINHYVWVKLTPMGRSILRKEHDDLRRSYPSLAEYTEPVVDEDGYTKFQLWSLMNTFGHCMMWGGNLPFETVVRFESHHLQSVEGDIEYQ